MIKRTMMFERNNRFFDYLIILCILFSFTAFPYMMVGNISTSDKIFVIILCYLALVLNVSSVLKLESKLIVFIYFFISFNFISTFLAENVKVALPFTLNYVVQMLLLLSFIVIYKNNENNRYNLIKTMYYISIILSLIAIVEKFFSNQIQSLLILFRQKNYQYDRVSSLFDNPNHLGIFLAIMFVIGIYYVFIENNKKFLFYNLLIFIAVIFTGTRMALLIIAVGLILLFITLLKYNYGIKNLNRKMIFFTLLIIILFFIMFLSGITRFEDLLNGLMNNDISQVTGSRSTIWFNVFGKFKENLLFGVGNGNFLIENFVGKKPITNAHSLYLSLLVENGLLGLLSFICIIIYSWKQRKRIIVIRERILFQVLLPVILFSQLTEMQLYNVFPFIILFWLIVSIPFSYEEKQRS